MLLETLENVTTQHTTTALVICHVTDF